MESFLESVVKRHKQGKKLSEGDIDFLIGVANSSLKLSESNARLSKALEGEQKVKSKLGEKYRSKKEENARLSEALEKIAYSTEFDELYKAEAFATQVLEEVSK